MPDTRIQVIGPIPGREGSSDRIGVVLGEGEPRPVLLHPVPRSVTGDPDLLALERREAEAAAELLHPNVQASFGIEEVQGAPVHVLAWIEGEPLSALIEASGRLPPDVAARVVTDACEAVQFARGEREGGRPRVHGDVTPDAVLVSASGVTLVAGFGRAAHPKPPRERLHLFSPEQVAGGPAAAVPQTDVYLLGLVLYACLAGEPPFAGEPDPERAVAEKPPPPLAPQGVPEKLAAVAERALAKKSSDRQATPGELARAIAEAVGELAPPSAVATYLDVFFPPEEGARAEQRRLVDEALAAARKTESADELIVGEPTPVPAPLDVVTTRDIVAEPPARPPPPAPAAPPAAPLAPPVVRGPPPPDLVTTRDIVGEVSAPSIFPRPNLGPPASRRRLAPWLVGAAIGAAGLAAGFALSFAGSEEPPAPAATQAPPSVRPPVPTSIPAGPSEPAPPPAKSPPARPKAALAAPSIEVTSSPSGDVFLDGKKVGRSPLVRAVGRGRHKVRLVERSRGIDLTKTVEVTGPRTAVRFAPGKGFVTVTAPEGAAIYVDGRKVGTTQIRDHAVFEGSHELKVTLGSAEHVTPFRLGPGETWHYEVSRTQ